MYHPKGNLTHKLDERWGPLIGRGKAFDPDSFFIFCANVLGSPYGTASPVTVDPSTGRPYGPEFPPTTIRDDVRCGLSHNTRTKLIISVSPSASINSSWTILGCLPSAWLSAVPWVAWPSLNGHSALLGVISSISSRSPLPQDTLHGALVGARPSAKASTATLRIRMDSTSPSPRQDLLLHG